MKRNGVATVMAIVVIGLLAVTLAVLTAGANRQQKRAALAADAAQASQLLAAAARTAEAQSAAGTKADGPVETPAGRVTLTWKTADACEARVVCRDVTRVVTLSVSAGRVTRVD